MFRIRRFVMAFHFFHMPMFLVNWLFPSSTRPFKKLSEFVSSSCQFDSSFYEFDSSLATLVRRHVSLCRSFFDVSTIPLSEAIIRLHEVLLDSMYINMRYLSLICFLLTEN